MVWQTSRIETLTLEVLDLTKSGTGHQVFSQNCFRFCLTLQPAENERSGGFLLPGRLRMGAAASTQKTKV